MVLFEEIDKNILYGPDSLTVDTQSISLYGQNLVIADNNHNSGNGKVYIYTKKSNKFEYTQELSSPNSKSEGYFGISSTINSCNLIVGAKGEEKVYIYTKKSNKFEYTQTIEIKDSSGLGNSLSFDGVNLAIGEETGERVHLYVKRGNNFHLKEKKHSPEKSISFGDRVLLQDSKLLIGDGTENKVYIYNRKGDKFEYTDTLNGIPGSNFGFNFVMDGCYLFIGASTDEEYGKVYIYIKKGNTFHLKQTLKGSEDANIGYYLSYDGVRLATSDTTGAFDISVYIKKGNKFEHSQNLQRKSASNGKISGVNLITLNEDNFITYVLK